MRSSCPRHQPIARHKKKTSSCQLTMSGATRLLMLPVQIKSMVKRSDDIQKNAVSIRVYSDWMGLRPFDGVKHDALILEHNYVKGHQGKSKRRPLLLYTNKAKLSGLGPLSSLLQ